MNLKKGVIIGAIARDERVLIPNGNDVIHCGDKVFVLSESYLEIHSPMDIFA
ncbi:MAG: TrkA C-terminal domain-containing protein [Acutalibacteraceae bacterium]